jgi:hypothetical protein
MGGNCRLCTVRRDWIEYRLHRLSHGVGFHRADDHYNHAVRSVVRLVELADGIDGDVCQHAGVAEAAAARRGAGGTARRTACSERDGWGRRCAGAYSSLRMSRRSFSSASAGRAGGEQATQQGLQRLAPSVGQHTGAEARPVALGECIQNAAAFSKALSSASGGSPTAPRKSRCSSRCATPEVSAVSCATPARTQTSTAVSGAFGTRSTMTCSPFASWKRLTLGVPHAAAISNRSSAPSARRLTAYSTAGFFRVPLPTLGGRAVRAPLGWATCP